MREETQLVWIEPNSEPLYSPKGAKTGWILLVPASEGGGGIAVSPGWSGSSPQGLTLELRGECRGRARAESVDACDGRTTWRWSAPDDSQLWRLVARTGSEQHGTLSGPFVVVQQIEPTSNGRVVLSIQGLQYRSKAIRAVSDDVTGGALLARGDGSVEYAPRGPRDHLVTRFLPLTAGVYELRLRVAAGDDPTPVRVRLQLRDSSWLETSTALVSHSDDGVAYRSLFEIRGVGKDVRLHLSTPSPAVLPRVQLVRVSESSAPATASIAAVDRTAAERAFDESVLKLATVPDEARLGIVLASATEAMIDRAVSIDPWLHNYVKNTWEFVHQRTTLTTYPPDVCVPIADVCNARCTFCTSWLEGTRIATLEQVDGFEQLFRFARWVGLAGHGEPLAHPRISEILSRLTAWLDPRAEGYVITNGVYLGGLLDELIASRIRRFAISLNAASAAVHREVMGLPDGSFQKILRTVERVVALRDSHGCRVSVSMVVTKQNIEEVPALIQLANDLGIDKVQLKTLAAVGGVIEGLNYHTLLPYEHPDYARVKANAVAAIASSGVPVQVDAESWDVPVFPAAFAEQIRTSPLRLVTREEALGSRSLRQVYHAQPKYQEKTIGRVLEHANDFDGLNPFGRAAPFACRAPYRHLYINDFSFNLSPCCYMGNVPGAEPVMYDGTDSFMAAWNSDAFVTLRRRLREGPLFNMCTKCPGTY